MRSIVISRARIVLTALLGIACFATGAAAQPLTPGDRLATWHDSFNQFALDNPGLSAEATDAVFEAMSLTEERFFADALGFEERETLIMIFGSLGGALSHNKYLDLVELIVDLVEWLRGNDVTDEKSALKTCICVTNEQCTESSSCKQIRCINEAGSKNTGVCG